MLSLHFASLSVCFYVLGISDIALGLERVVLCRPLVSSESQWNNFSWSSEPGAVGVTLCILACLPVVIGSQFLQACCMTWQLLQCPCRLVGPHRNCLRSGHNYCRCARGQDGPSVRLVVRPSCDHCRCAGVQGWPPGKGDDLEGCQLGWSESHFKD